jgi:serine O-acetyltransferase
MKQMLVALRGRLADRWRHVVATPDSVERRAFWRALLASHPPFAAAVVADAVVTAARRGERHEYRSPLDAAVQVVRLSLVTESFFAQVCYRGKARCQALRIPLAPRLLHHAAVVTGQIAIGDPVVVAAGVFIPHGQTCIDGITVIGPKTVIGPYTTIGLRTGDFVGPTIGTGVAVGTGARILGPWTIGAGATIGANAVVTSDVPPGTTAVGVPARIR